MTPADYIWALVCHYPSPRRERRPLFMLRAYLDESQDGDVLVFSGFVALPDKWAAFVNDWQQVLDMRPRIAHFHLEEAIGFKGEFAGISVESRDEKIGLLRAVIYDHELTQISSFLPLRAFADTFGVLDIRHPKRIKNPYVWLFYAMISEVVMQLKEGHLKLPEEEIDFFFDERVMERAKIDDGWDGFKENTWAPRHLIGMRPQFLDDKRALPLQAADLAAGFSRAQWRNRFLGEPHLEFPAFRKREIPRAGFVWTEDLLKDMVVQATRRCAELTNTTIVSLTYDGRKYWIPISVEWLRGAPPT